MRYVTTALLLTASIVGITSQASAATVVYEGQYQQSASLQKVNGNINYILYSIEYTGYQTFALAGVESQGNPIVRTFGTYDVFGGLSFAFSDIIAAQRSGGATLYYKAAITQILTEGLSYFEGSGTFDIGVTVSDRQFEQLAGQNIDFSRQLGGAPFFGNYRLVIDYDEVPAIPEPSTWALMLAGFGMVGYAMRRRKVAFA